MHNQFQLVNPFREPSWRFQRVLDLVERDQPGRCTQRDDTYVKQYRRFAGKFRSARSEEARMALFPEYPGLFLAHLFHHQPDKEWRWLLQARILTGENDEKISQRMATLPSAVDWYEKVFFNIRDRLEATDYITKQIIGKTEDRAPLARKGQLTDFQEQISYKLFGYFGGPLILDIMFSGFTKMPMPERQDQTDAWLDATVQTLVRRKATHAARHLEIHEFNIMQLLELQLRIVEASEEAGGSATDFERNVAEVLNNVPWELAEVRAKARAAAVDNKDYIPTAVEPRVEELMQLAIGQVPRKLLRDRKLQILPPNASEKVSM